MHWMENIVKRYIAAAYACQFVTGGQSNFSRICQVVPMCSPVSYISLGPPESTSETASRSVQPFSAGLMVVKDKQTDYATPSETIGRIYVLVLRSRCGLKWEVRYSTQKAEVRVHPQTLQLRLCRLSITLCTPLQVYTASRPQY